MGGGVPVGLGQLRGVIACVCLAAELRSGACRLHLTSPTERPALPSCCAALLPCCPALPCPADGPHKTFATLKSLKMFLQQQHKLQFCDICLEGRKVGLWVGLGVAVAGCGRRLSV